MRVLLLAALALGPAYQAGDVAGLRRAGAAGDDVGVALRSPDRATVLGAIVAAEAAPDAWVLLEPLAVVAGGWDRAAAGPAARAAARIARSLDGDAAIAQDMPDERLAVVGAAWQALADRADRWSDVRVHALEVAMRVARARVATADDAIAPVQPTSSAGAGPRPVAWDDTATIVAASSDADPQVRRAALELLPVPAPVTLRAALVTRLSSDSDPAVRLAAAQALCAAMPDDAAAVLAALGEPGLEALRAAVGAPPEGAGGALLDAARCLAADRDPKSLRALVALRQTAPRPLRAAVARVAADVRAQIAENAP